MLGKKKQSVGLYIGPRTMAMAEVRLSASGAIMVDKLAVLDTPPDAVYDAGIADIGEVTKAIQELLIANNVKSGEVTLVTSTGGIIARVLTLPTIPRNEMLEVLRGEVEDYAVLAGEELMLDFQVVNQKTEGIGQKSEVLVVAAAKSLLDSYITAVEAATNLTLTAMEAMPITTLRGFTGAQLREQAQLMLVNVEESGGVVVVVQNGVIRFLHTIQSGSQGLSEDDGVLGELAEELISSLNYCQMMFSEEAVTEEIVLLMDGSNGAHICQQLEKHIDIPVTCPQPLETADEHIKDQMMAYGLSAYAAIGAAVRVRSGDRIVNLLRPQTPEITYPRKMALVLLVCLLPMVLTSVCASLILKARAGAILERVADIQQHGVPTDSSTLSEILSMESEVLRLEAEMNEAGAAISSIKYIDWSMFLQEIRAAVPRTIWLAELSLGKDNSIAFAGFAISYDSVFKFRDKLADSSYFHSVRFAHAQNSIVGVDPFVKFEITCKIPPEVFDETAESK